MAPPSWSLVDCEARHREHPDTFDIPSPSRRRRLRIGDAVQLIFTNGATEGCTGERMWVRLLELPRRGGFGYAGTLANAPEVIGDLKFGDRIGFEGRHIAKVDVVTRKTS